MRRSIILFFICLFFLFFITKKPVELPVFLLNSTPTVIANGQFHNAFILAISFEHESLIEFIESNDKPITYLVTVKLLNRSPNLSKTLHPASYQVGLLGETSEAYEQDTKLLQRELDNFEKIFHMKPMYFMTADSKYPKELLKQLATAEINAIAPTKLNSFNTKLKEGQHVYIDINEGSTVSFSKMAHFLNSSTFTSIEETIFNSSISTSSAP